MSSRVRQVVVSGVCAAITCAGSVLLVSPASAQPQIPPQSGVVVPAPPLAEGPNGLPGASATQGPTSERAEAVETRVPPPNVSATPDAPPMTQIELPVPQTIDEAREQIRTLQQQSSAAAERANGVREQLERTQERISGLARQSTDSRIELLRQQRALELMAKQIYVNGGFSGAALSFALDDPERFLADLDRLISASDSQSAVLMRTRAQFVALKNIEDSLRQEQDRLVRTTEALAVQQTEAAARLAQAERVLQSLEEEQRERLLAEARAAAETARLEAEVARRALQVQMALDADVVDPPSSLALSGLGADEAAVRRVIDFALSKVGGPYVWGASGPDAYDCSGLTQAAWAQAGVRLTHYSGTQYTGTVPVALSDIKPGDLLYFYNIHQHVGLYIGEGRFVHAANSNDGIRLDSLTGHYLENLVAASRPGVS